MSQLSPAVTWREKWASLTLLPRFVHLAYEHEPRLALAVVASRVARALVPIAALWVGKLLLDQVVAGVAAPTSTVPSSVMPLLLLELVLVASIEVVVRFAGPLEALLGDRLGNRLSVRLISHTAALDLEQIENPRIADQLERARQRAIGSPRLIGLALTMAQDAIALLVLTATVAALVPYLLLLLAISIVPAFLGEMHFAAASYSLLFSWTPERRRLDYLRFVGASAHMAKEVKLFSLRAFLAGRYERLAAAYTVAHNSLALKRARIGSLFALLGLGGHYAAYAAIVWMTLPSASESGPRLSVGSMVFLIGAFRQVRDMLQRFIQALAETVEGTLSLRDLFDYFAIMPTLDNPSLRPPVARGGPLRMHRCLTFEDVGFRYPTSERWALRHVSFELRAGERVAIVGENGAGKTTLIKLVTRLYEPTEGRILLDGCDVRMLDVDDVRALFGVIFQDFARYEFTLGENISVADVARMGEEAAIVAASRRSAASEIADMLPNGYQEQLGRIFAQGRELSGGEWQKIALARAYFRRADVLVLDEPTAALDARAEAAVYRQFRELAQGKTVVLISHRFSTVRAADRIIVLHGGGIVEEGTHQDLLSAAGLYAELYALQQSGGGSTEKGWRPLTDAAAGTASSRL